MTGYITKQGKHSWGVRISAGFDPVTGKRRRIYRTVQGTKRDAERELVRIQYEIEMGTDFNPARLTTADFFSRWLQHQRAQVRPSTWDAYESRVRIHIVPKIGRLLLPKVRPVHIQAVLDDMTCGGQSSRSVLHGYRVLHSAFRQARRWQLITTDPTDAISPPRASRPQLEIPDAAGLDRLIRTAEGTPHELPVLIDVATGLRRAELLGLRWRDIDSSAARLRVTMTLQRLRRPDGSIELALVEPKTRRSRREIALPSFALEALKRHRKEQAERRLQHGSAWHDLDFVFERGDGFPINPYTLTQGFRRLANKAGLPKTRLHDLRHAFATALLIKGVHPKIVSEALGHSSVAFTLDTYSHVLPGLQDAVAQAMQSVWESSRGSEEVQGHP